MELRYLSDPAEPHKIRIYFLLKVSSRVGANDAGILSKEFSKAISENDLIGLSNWHAYVRLLINGNVNFPFNMGTILPETRPQPEVVPQIWEYSRET